MKKVLSLVLVFVMMISFATAGNAQYYEFWDTGIAYSIADDWTCTTADNQSALFVKDAGREMFMIEYANLGARAELLKDDATITEALKEMVSNENLKKIMQEANNTFSISVTSSYEAGRIEYINNTKYWVYEKSYTSSGFGYETQNWYRVAYAAIRNGYLYLIQYLRPAEQNNFVAVSNLLNSIEFLTVMINVNGNEVYPDTTPKIIDGRTMIPIRAVSEAMGYDVSWDASTKTVSLSNGSNTIKFQIGSYTATSTYGSKALDVPAQIIESRTYLPVRAVSELMGATVTWNGDLRIVDIWP